jgi:hypothetical protein
VALGILLCKTPIKLDLSEYLLWQIEKAACAHLNRAQAAIFIIAFCNEGNA